MPRLPFLTISLSLVKLCLWRQWCYPAISSSVVPCPHSFSVSKSFPMSHLIASSGQSIGASAPMFPMNIRDWFSLGLTGLILLSKELSRVFLSTTIWKHQFSGAQPSLWFNSHLYMTTGKTIALTTLTSADKVIFLLFNTLSSFVIAFLPRSKFLLISWLQSPSTIYFWSPRKWSVTVSTL